MVTRWKPNQLSMGSVIQGDGAITNLDFHRDGKHLVMTTNESSLHIIDVLSGAEKKKIYCKNSGIGKVKFTHNDNCFLMSSSSKNHDMHDIRYFCSYDNRYLRYFSGHTDLVTSLTMCPTDDSFLSASMDKTICLWSLASTSPTAKLKLPSNFDRPYAAFDPSGVVFGVLAYDTVKCCHTLRLFDARSFDRGPFQDIAPSIQTIENVLNQKLANNPNINQKSFTQRSLQAQWVEFEFSPDGQRILVNTQSDLMLSIDSFNSDAEPSIIVNRKNDAGLSLGACFSADGNYIISGNDDNELQIFDVHSGDFKYGLTGHVSPVGCVRSNPRFDVLASGCVNTALWIHV